MMDKEKFGSLLFNLRKEKKLTQQEFADIFHVTSQAVSKWEKGESLPDITTLEQLSEFYSISINDLLNGKRTDDNSDNNEIANDCTNNTFSTEHINNRSLKLIITSVFLFLFIIFSCLPFIADNGITASFFALIFSSNFNIGNALFLGAFLMIITSNFIGILAVFHSNPIKLIGYEELLLIGSYVLFASTMMQFINYLSVGAFLLFILFTGYLIAFLFNGKLHFNNMFINKKQTISEQASILLIMVLFNSFVNLSRGGALIFVSFVAVISFISFLSLLIVCKEKYIGWEILSLVIYATLSLFTLIIYDAMNNIFYILALAALISYIALFAFKYKTNCLFINVIKLVLLILFTILYILKDFGFTMIFCVLFYLIFSIVRLKREHN